MEERTKLFSEFPPVTVAEWEEKIKEDLKGADYAKKLIRKTLDNITIKPYYTAAELEPINYLEQVPGSFPFVRGDKPGNNNWEIRQDFKVTDIETVVEKVDIALSRGVTAIGFDLKGKGDLYYHDFRQMISGIDLTKTPVSFLVADTAPQILDYLLKALDDLKVSRSDFKGSLEFDPLGHLASTGGFYNSEEDDMQNAAKLLSVATEELPGLRVMAVNSHLFSDAGVSAVQELAYGLAMMADYLVRYTNEEHNVTVIAKHLQWNIGTGADYFIEIAKIRAARMLFSALLSGFDSKAIDSSVFIHSITTKWNKTLYDPNVNLLRLTTEAMSATLGGCDSLLVRPFDSTYNEPTDFSERLARNIQIILKEESYFNKVVDPSAGSYYIESLTNSLIENAWDLFLTIDDQGGFIKSFAQGIISSEVKKSADRRTEMVASRREILLGTNQYPNMNESVSGCIAEDIAFPEAGTNDKQIAKPIFTTRAAAEFEKLRLAVEQRKEARPKVFMLTYGNLAIRLARSQFSTNFFACAGYEIIDNLGFKTAKDGVDAALNAHANIIVICSSDDEYPEIAPAVAELAKDKAILVVAGTPPGMEELKQMGISEFIHLRSNVVETLKAFHHKLGIELK
jgi:methylmalonyl-CoA mutase